MKKLLFLFFALQQLNNPLHSQIIDSTFGVPTSMAPTGSIFGTVACDFGGHHDQALGALHLEDGRIILAGYTKWSGLSDFALAHLTENGHFDSTALSNGQAIIDIYPVDSCVSAIRYPGDRILLGGCTYLPSGNKYTGLIARVDFNGNLDTSFGNSGHILVNPPSDQDVIIKMLVLSDEKILVSGLSAYGNVPFEYSDSVKIFISRLHPNGVIDSTFGTNGFIYTQIDKDCNSALVRDMVLDGQNRILLTGETYDPLFLSFDGLSCAHNVSMCRFLPNGQPDSTFSDDGFVEIMHTQTGFGVAVLPYEDGRILLTGAAENTYPTNVFLTRLLPNGSIDSTFGVNGQFNQPLINYGTSDLVEPIGLLRMRNRILVGLLNTLGGDDYGCGLLCFTEQGTLDANFGIAGIFNPYPNYGFRTYINQISSTADNNIFLSGYYRILQPNNMYIIKIRWDETSAVGEASQVNQIAIYPNPVANTGDIHLDYGSMTPLRLWISDIHGRIVYSSTDIAPQQPISLPGLTNGIYFVYARGLEGNMVGRLVVSGF